MPGGVHPNREGGNEWTFVAVRPTAIVAAQTASATAEREGEAEVRSVRASPTLERFVPGAMGRAADGSSPSAEVAGLERTPPSPGVEQADPGYDWIMETIVVGYDGTEHAERALACSVHANQQE